MASVGSVPDRPWRSPRWCGSDTAGTDLPDCQSAAGGFIPESDPARGSQQRCGARALPFHRSSGLGEQQAQNAFVEAVELFPGGLCFHSSAALVWWSSTTARRGALRRAGEIRNLDHGPMRQRVDVMGPGVTPSMVWVQASVFGCRGSRRRSRRSLRGRSGGNAASGRYDLDPDPPSRSPAAIVDVICSIDAGIRRRRIPAIDAGSHAILVAPAASQTCRR